MSLNRRRTVAAALRIVLFVSLLASTGCVSAAWNRALGENSAAAYHQFLEQHGDSDYARLAEERIAFIKLERKPTLANYDAFRREFPDTVLAGEVLRTIEQPAFEAALALGTADAYREFVAGFTRGAYAARAAGNAVYVEADGFRGNPSQLEAFARNYAASDFAAEASRTANAVAALRGSRVDRVELVIVIEEATPEAERVRKALTERTLELSRGLGLTILHPQQVAGLAESDGAPIARLEIRHAERAVDRAAGHRDFARPGVIASTDVSLSAEGASIAHRRFELRVDRKAHVPGSSLLFSRASAPYWREFFIPVARWQNDAAVRPPVALNRSVVDVASAGDRAFVLYEDGDLELISLADPVLPVRLVTYERGDDHLKWTGLRMLGDRIAIFGEEGLEIVRFADQGPVAELRLPRGQIGRVMSLASVGEELISVGAKGIQIIDPKSGAVRRVMRRAMKSVAVAGRTLVFADGEKIYISTLELLRQNRVLAQTKLGRVFGPDHVRVLDRTAIVTGPGGALVIDLTNPQKPKAVAKLPARRIGRVHDAARVGGRTFLVGERGLQVLSRRLDRVEEFVDVGDRRRLSVMGRHLVAADGASIQVVDATPWSDASTPAAAAP